MTAKIVNPNGYSFTFTDGAADSIISQVSELNTHEDLVEYIYAHRCFIRKKENYSNYPCIKDAVYILTGYFFRGVFYIPVEICIIHPDKNGVIGTIAKEDT